MGSSFISNSLQVVRWQCSPVEIVFEVAAVVIPRRHDVACRQREAVAVDAQHRHALFCWHWRRAAALAH